MKCSNCGFETEELIYYCPVCATSFNQPTSEENKNIKRDESPHVNLSPEVNQTFEVNQVSQDNQSSEVIKDWFTGNVVMIVISSIFICCMNILAFGSLATSIIGIVYSNKVKNSIANNKYDEAKNESSTAKTMFYVSLGINILSILIIIGIILIYGVLFYSIITSSMNEY